MKVSVKGVSITVALFCAMWVFWSVLMDMLGFGSTPYNFFNEMYFGWLPTGGIGLIVGAIFGFIDGLVGGAVFSWIYNKIAA